MRLGLQRRALALGRLERRGELGGPRVRLARLGLRVGQLARARLELAPQPLRLVPPLPRRLLRALARRLQLGAQPLAPLRAPRERLQLPAALDRVALEHAQLGAQARLRVRRLG